MCIEKVRILYYFPFGYFTGVSLIFEVSGGISQLIMVYIYKP